MLRQVSDAIIAPNADDRTLDASQLSASTSLATFAKSVPASVKGRLIPLPILFWLRSRLDIEGE